jgi:hypothetical protein
MRAFNLTQVSDAELLRDLGALVVRDRSTTALVLAHIAEVDARKLWAPAGYSSMHAYCVEELHMSDDAAYKRIQAARAARAHPELFDAVADGRLHLTAVCLLAPFLTPESAESLIAAATHRRKPEIIEALAARFPSPVPPRPIVRAIPIRPMRKLAPAQVDAPAPSLLSPPEPPSPPRFIIHATIPKATHDKLRYAQELLSHAVPSGDVAQLLDRALDSLIAQLERRKFAATRRPSAHPRSSTRRRHIPARVRRAVWERDRGQCTFVGASGHRCGARKFLEFDHADPVALGGKPTLDRIRLRCRVHNHLEAVRALGADFVMRHRRAAHAHGGATAGSATPRVDARGTGEEISTPRCSSP